MEFKALLSGPDGDPNHRRLPPAIILPQGDTERALIDALAAEAGPSC